MPVHDSKFPVQVSDDGIENWHSNALPDVLDDRSGRSSGISCRSKRFENTRRRFPKQRNTLQKAKKRLSVGKQSSKGIVAQVVDSGTDDHVTEPIVASGPVLKASLALLSRPTGDQSCLARAKRLKISSRTLSNFKARVSERKNHHAYDHCSVILTYRYLCSLVLDVVRNCVTQVDLFVTYVQMRYSLKSLQTLLFLYVVFVMASGCANGANNGDDGRPIEFASFADFANDVSQVGSTKIFKVIRTSNGIGRTVYWYYNNRCDHALFNSKNTTLQNYDGLITNCSSDFSRCVFGFEKISYNYSGYHCFGVGTSLPSIAVAVQVIGDPNITCDTRQDADKIEVSGVFEMSGPLVVKHVALLTDRKSILCNFSYNEQLSTEYQRNQGISKVVEFSECVVANFTLYLHPWNISVYFHAPTFRDSVSTAKNHPNAAFAVCNQLAEHRKSDSRNDVSIAIIFLVGLIALIAILVFGAFVFIVIRKLINGHCMFQIITQTALPLLPSR